MGKGGVTPNGQAALFSAAERDLEREALEALASGMALADLPDELLFAIRTSRDVSELIETMIAEARALNDIEGHWDTEQP